MNVDVAARSRLRRVFNDFPHVYVSFSGGKDSGLLVNLALDVAAEMGRLPLDVLIVDLEGQYQTTIDYIGRVASREDVRAHWVCLPLHLRNSVSQFQPFWLCWDPSMRGRWIRPMPDHPAVISDESYFPFFRRGMEFEEFTPEYSHWKARTVGGRVACLVGIRADESYNRYRTVRNEEKGTWEGLLWTTKLSDQVYNAYPIYDWRTEDVWTANGRNGYDYNRVYDLMHLAGLSIHQMRLCQPYGDDQRKGLWLYKVLEPDTWTRVVARVEGANFGAREARGRGFAHLKAILPDGHTWESYSKLLLATMPAPLAAHYQQKIDRFIWWYQEKEGYATIPDEADPKLESARKVPSWRRIAKVLLKNDYWCKGLSFSMTKREHDRRLALALSYLEKR